MFNSWDQNMSLCFVGPDFGINCLQMLSADDTGKQRVNSMHARIQRAGGQGVRTPLKNHKFIGFPSNTSPDPLKITKLPSQHSMWAIIGPPVKPYFNGRHIIARFWWFLEPPSPEKKLDPL